jgi:hypothetical protein
LFDTEYYVFADKYPDINSAYDWNSAPTEVFGVITMYRGPSGQLVDIDFQRNQDNYTQSQMSVRRSRVYESDDKQYNANSIVVDSGGNYIKYDEWFFADPNDMDGGFPYFSPMFPKVNDLLDMYNKELEDARLEPISVKLNNSTVFPPLNTSMNLKINKPIVKAPNSVTRKEKEGGTVIKVSR